MICLNPRCETPTPELLCERDWQRLHPSLVAAYLDALNEGKTREVEQKIFRFFSALERFKELAS